MNAFESCIDTITGLGIVLPHDIYDIVLAKFYGGEAPKQEEWSRQDRVVLKKACERELLKYRDRFDIKPSFVAEEAVDHLWWQGWSIKTFGKTVTGIEKAIQVFVEIYYPKDMAPLEPDEMDNTWLQEVLSYIKKYDHIECDNRQCRMLLRSQQIPAYIFEIVISGDIGSRPEYRPSLSNIILAAETFWNTTAQQQIKAHDRQRSTTSSVRPLTKAELRNLEDRRSCVNNWDHANR